MYDRPRLTDAEWRLVIELLEQELHELPVEIRHTRTAEYVQGLHHRLEMVQDLLERLRAAAAAQPTPA